MRINAFFFIVISILVSGTVRSGASPQTVNMNPYRSTAFFELTGAGLPRKLSGDVLPVMFIVGPIQQNSGMRFVSSTAADSNSRITRSATLIKGVFGDSQSSPSLGAVSIGGHVMNASGGIPPQNSFMDLTIYENDQVLDQFKIPLDGTGIFRFNSVPWNPGYSYLVSVVYNNIRFTSSLIDGGLLSPGVSVDIPVVVYETSTNALLLQGLRMRVIYDFSTPGWVHVAETILISNPTSLVIVPSSDTEPILEFPLPKDATNVVFLDGNQSDRFRMTDKGFGDWQPILPGDGHQVLVEYSAPFESTWNCNLATPIPLDSLMVVVRSNGIETSSYGLQLSLVQSDNANSISVYTASGIAAGQNASLLFTTRDQIQRIWLGIGILTATLLLALVWIIRSKHVRINAQKLLPVAENSENVDTILDAIIALDDRYRHGDIPADAYQKARSELGEQTGRIENLNKGLNDPSGKSGQVLPEKACARWSEPGGTPGRIGDPAGCQWRWKNNTHSHPRHVDQAYFGGFFDWRVFRG